MEWLSNPWIWVFLFPALISTGLVIQMVASLFSCCGTFRIQGRAILLRWWMIPCGSCVALLFWVGVAAGVFTAS